MDSIRMSVLKRECIYDIYSSWQIMLLSRYLEQTKQRKVHMNNSKIYSSQEE